MRRSNVGDRKMPDPSPNRSDFEKEPRRSQGQRHKMLRTISEHEENGRKSAAEFSRRFSSRRTPYRRRSSVRRPTRPTAARIRPRSLRSGARRNSLPQIPNGQRPQYHHVGWSTPRTRTSMFHKVTPKLDPSN